MRRSKNWILYTILAGTVVSAVLIVWFEWYLMTDKYGWYSLIFWIPFSALSFWVSHVVCSFLVDVTTKWVVPPIARLLDKWLS